MPIRNIFKISRKTFFNPSGWLDFESLKSQNRTLFDILRTVFTPDVSQREETFEQAKARLKLSEADIKKSIQNYHFIAICFVVLGTATLLYSVYLLFFYALFSGFLLGLATASLFFAQAFKYDFWAFQMQHRKLGVSFTEWKNHLLGRKGKSSS